LHEAAEQAGGLGRFEQHRALSRVELAAVQACQRAFGGVASDRFGRGQQGGVARRGVPVVALHVPALAGDRRDRDGVARVGVAAREAERVGDDEMRLLGIHAGAFAVGHALVDGKGGGFAAQGQLHGFFCGHEPGVAQLEVAWMHFQHVGFGQAGAIVDRGEAGDVVGGIDRGFERLARKVGRAGVAAAHLAQFAQVDGDAHALVFVLLDGVDLALAHADGQPLPLVNFNQRLGCAFFLCISQHVLGDLLELLLGMGKDGFAHGLDLIAYHIKRL